MEEIPGYEPFIPTAEACREQARMSQFPDWTEWWEERAVECEQGLPWMALRAQ